jgi:signal transduction histidine kinase
MANTERTKNLPFVRGDIAKFRHYAGVPLNPYGGPNIGTVFMFSEKPSEAGSSSRIRSYLADTALHVTKHLEQAVEALEGKRALRFNRGVTTLTSMSHNIDSGVGAQRSTIDAECETQSLSSNRYSNDALRLYYLATSLLCDIFGLDGAKIQELGSEDGSNSNSGWNGSLLMAHYLRPNVPKPGDVHQALLKNLLQLFPQGAVLQVARDSGEVIAATDTQPATKVDNAMSKELSQAFPEAEQIILMPLWDTYYESNIGAVLGFAYDRLRAYLGPNDLSSISAFCLTLMTQVRRLEVQAMEQIKSDLLGSVSHEMRTPLHGILSNLELLAETSFNKHQHALLEMAQYSGVALLDSIDRLLDFSKVSSGVQQTRERSPQGLSGWVSRQSSPTRDQRAISPSEENHPSIIHVCERLVRQAERRIQLKRSVRPELHGPRQSAGSQHLTSSSPGPDTYPLVIFDTNATWSCRLVAGPAFETIFTNLLVCCDCFSSGLVVT